MVTVAPTPTPVVVIGGLASNTFVQNTVQENSATFMGGPTLNTSARSPHPAIRTLLDSGGGNSENTLDLAFANKPLTAKPLSDVNAFTQEIGPLSSSLSDTSGQTQFIYQASVFNTEELGQPNSIPIRRHRMNRTR